MDGAMQETLAIMLKQMKQVVIAGEMKGTLVTMLKQTTQVVIVGEMEAQQTLLDGIVEEMEQMVCTFAIYQAQVTSLAFLLNVNGLRWMDHELINNR